MKRLGLMVACVLVLVGCEKPAPDYEYHTIIVRGTDASEVNAKLAQGWAVSETKLHERPQGSSLSTTVYVLKRARPSE